MKIYLGVLLAMSGAFSVEGAAFPSEMMGGFHLDIMKKEIPAVASSESMTIANLNLDGQGNVIIAKGGERIWSRVNFSCNTDYIEENSLNQIVIGYEGLGFSKCIFNELGYRCGGEGIIPFVLEAPREPGIYNVQCSLEQSPSRMDAMQNWANGTTIKMTIGRVIVVN